LSYYNQSIRTTTPIFLTSWPRNKTNAWIADVRAACLTPDADVQAGSVVPTNGATTKNYGNNVEMALWTMVLLALGLLQ
jgi:hypothetical protein